ncbi:Na+:H+ antiporter, NhaC family [Dethiosulfatibacter aminovorans DSM 17477]|uniref:Na+:H+ antiporter, NhaC family n=1 Tax=Dethiosulfatibacter aminovorans DSM 17477 TaxID=1121476 RepID=A0A1M6F408_9FIRM|nr:Na+/H+ antiporter NhaC [Dethiosulfatibacter aminovorans]SHI92339.1 Na+:H+ antiporter, NhaC family [Dethiosulfatibacter aminovorans DSM 17477]
MNLTTKNERKPSLLIASIPFLSMLLFVTVGIIKLGVDPQIPLLAGTVVATIVGKYLGYSWKSMEKSIIDSIGLVMQACLIIMIIGCLIGVWVAGGIVPGMVYYGLKIFTPKFFLVIVVLLCSIVSMATGSSWTTAGTIGVAAMGVGSGLGIPPAMTAGAIISGAIFGDKMSPLSDSTNLAPGIAGADLFDHIRHMVYTTGPSYIISIILFLFLGLNYQSGQVDAGAINDILATLESEFWISPLLLIAPVFVIAMVVLRIPAIPGMIGGTFVGIIFSAIQGLGFRDILSVLHYGYEITTQNELVNTLLNRGGLDSMMWTISLVICALSFGGVIERTGCLETIITVIMKFCKSRGSIILSNILVCISMNFIAADQYMAIVIPGKMYKPIYKRLNLKPKNLSRVLEDSGTLTSPLVPWSTCGAFYFATLGVHAFDYLPFTFLALINPIVSIIYGFTGITMEEFETAAETEGSNITNV